MTEWENGLILVKGLEFDVIVIISFKGKKFVMGTGFADCTIFDKVSDGLYMNYLVPDCVGNERNTYMRSAFWIVDKR